MKNKQQYMKEVLGDSGYRPSPNGIARKEFDNTVKIVPFADWDYYYLNESIRWRPMVQGNGLIRNVNVPRGFVTDLASIPRVLWPILPPTEKYTLAAIVHDYLYWTQSGTRQTADRAFKLGMDELRVPQWKIFAIYTSVRWFGGGAWNHNSRLKALGEKRVLRRFPRQPNISWEDWRFRNGVFM